MRSVLLRTTLAASVVAVGASVLVSNARADNVTYNFSIQRNGQTQCIGTWGGSLTNGTQLIPWSCNPSGQAKDQAWWFDTSDCLHTETYGDFCRIRNGVNNKCMGVYGGSQNDGAYLVLWDCLGDSHGDQYWQLDGDGAGNNYIVNWSGWFASIYQDCDPWPYGCEDPHIALGYQTKWSSELVTP